MSTRAGSVAATETAGAPAGGAPAGAAAAGAAPAAAPRVPLRVRHSEGGGALGTFTVTHDVSAFTRAALFQPGATTPVTVRFSSTIGYLGSPDAWRDVRGFAVKFATPDGEYDLVGNNSPVFFLREHTAFASLVVSQKLRGGGTGLPAGAGGASELFDYDRLWEFWTSHPETAHQVTWLLGDRGIPRSWRHQNGYGTHTYQWQSAAGEHVWVKYRFESEQGVEGLSTAEAEALAATGVTETQHYRGDLAAAIGRGEHPSWRVSVQVMPHADAFGCGFDPFDITKVWPHADYPQLPLGRLVLDRNPADHVTEIEQAAFSPSNFVPGIAASPGGMLQARIASYPTFHKHRVVASPLPSRRPDETPSRYFGDDDPALLALTRPVHTLGTPRVAVGADPAGRADRAGARVEDDFSQAGVLVRDVLTPEARARLAATIAEHLAPVTRASIRTRALEYWHQVDPGLAAEVAALLPA